MLKFLVSPFYKIVFAFYLSKSNVFELINIQDASGTKLYQNKMHFRKNFMLHL